MYQAKGAWILRDWCSGIKILKNETPKGLYNSNHGSWPMEDWSPSSQAWRACTIPKFLNRYCPYWAAVVGWFSHSHGFQAMVIIVLTLPGQMPWSLLDWLFAHDSCVFFRFRGARSDNRGARSVKHQRRVSLRTNSTLPYLIVFLACQNLELFFALYPRPWTIDMPLLGSL
jgi:hypothetical protein